jgi:hypothetical protein
MIFAIYKIFFVICLTIRDGDYLVLFSHKVNTLSELNIGTIFCLRGRYETSLKVGHLSN